VSLFPNPELLGHYTPIRNRNCLAWPASTFPVLTPASPTSVRPRSLPPSHRSPTRPHRWPTQDRSAMQTHRFTGRPQSTRKPALTRMALTKAREVRKTVPFSPCGRRWREAPDEGSAAQLRRTAPNSPLPSPLPQGEREYSALKSVPFRSDPCFGPLFRTCFGPLLRRPLFRRTTQNSLPSIT
jgi:hypothetical protein